MPNFGWLPNFGPFQRPPPRSFSKMWITNEKRTKRCEHVTSWIWEPKDLNWTRAHTLDDGQSGSKDNSRIVDKGLQFFKSPANLHLLWYGIRSLHVPYLSNVLLVAHTRYETHVFTMHFTLKFAYTYIWMGNSTSLQGDSIECSVKGGGQLLHTTIPLIHPMRPLGIVGVV